MIASKIKPRPLPSNLIQIHHPSTGMDLRGGATEGGHPGGGGDFNKTETESTDFTEIFVSLR
jgi:hypothetical protein